MPEGLFGMILDNPINEYKTFDVSMTPNAIGWVELGVSYTRDIDENWRGGGRLKYVNGLMSVQSTGMDVTVRKEYDRYTVTGDYALRGGNVDFSGTFGFHPIGVSNGITGLGDAVHVGHEYADGTYRAGDDAQPADVGQAETGVAYVAFLRADGKGDLEGLAFGGLEGGVDVEFDVCLGADDACAADKEQTGRCQQPA